MSAAEGTNARRALTWIAVGAGVLLVAGGGLVLLTLGDGDTSPEDPPAATPPPQVVPEQVDAPTVTVAVTYDILVTRDPFAPVRPPEQDRADPVDGTDPSGNDGDPPDPQDPQDPQDPSGNGDPPPTTVNLPVIVYEVGSQGAVVQVGDVIYDARVGETFATRYRIEAIVNGCARIRDLDSGGEGVVCPTTQAFK